MRDFREISSPDGGAGTAPRSDGEALENDPPEDSDEGTPRGDIHHDPWLTPSSPALKSLAADIFAAIKDNSPRPSRQRTDAAERRKAIVENIVASLALLFLYYSEGTRMAVSVKNEASTRYDRPQFPRDVLNGLLRDMEAMGLLIRHRGTRGRHRTTIEPTPGFRTMLPEADVEMALGRADGAETIILKASTGRGTPKVPVDYQDTPETIAMREDMRTINGALLVADIRLGGRVQPPALLTRRFQIESLEAPHTFDQHGRLYGGFWISLRKDQRHLLTIDGQDIVDLDFAGMLPALAYLEAGLRVPNSHSYEGIEGLPRDAAKLGLSSLLCRTGPMRRLPSKLRQLVGKEWNAERLVAALADRHPGIAPMFCRGLGLSLFYRESCIMVSTLLRLIGQGIPALPVHDGLVVGISHEKEARTAMARASLEIVKTALPVVRKAIVRP